MRTDIAATVNYIKARIAVIVAQPTRDASSRKQLADVVKELRADLRRLACDQVR